VFARLGHALVLFALLTAIGAHWVLLQSVAWTTMLAENLRTNSLPEAVERTFDGRHPCTICQQIAKSKQSEKKSEFTFKLSKLEFPYLPFAFVFRAPSWFWKVQAGDEARDVLTHSPPVPPPRGFPA